MKTSAPVMRIAELVIAFSAVANCGGKVVRLGDGPNGSGGVSTSVDGGGGSDGGDSCLRGQVKASEVLWIGDSWVQIPGTQHDRVRDLARIAGTLGPTEDFVDQAANGTTMAAIANQYNTQEAGVTKVKVLLMDGGGWDTILAGGSDASVASAVSTFKQHLAKVASDGTVQQIVYFLYPELVKIPGVAALRPGMQQACAASTVPCHFLDLQPRWAGHPEYTDAASGIQASDSGAKIIGDAIWAIMQQNCIAQ